MPRNDRERWEVLFIFGVVSAIGGTVVGLLAIGAGALFGLDLAAVVLGAGIGWLGFGGTAAILAKAEAARTQKKGREEDA
jgi:amino acid transporter